MNMEKLNCPTCNCTLSKETFPGGIIWKCNICNGMMANTAVLRKYLSEKIAKDFYRFANEHNAKADKLCPSCRQNLFEFKFCKKDADEFILNICRVCQIIWFDEDKLNKFERKNHIELSDNSKKQVAIAEIILENERITNETKAKRIISALDRILTCFLS